MLCFCALTLLMVGVLNEMHRLASACVIFQDYIKTPFHGIFVF